MASSGLKNVDSIESLQRPWILQEQAVLSMRLRLPWHHLAVYTPRQDDTLMMKLLARVVFPSASYRLEAWDLSVADFFMNNFDNYSQNISIKLELLPKVFLLSIFTSRYLARAESQTQNWHSKAITLCKFLNVLKIYWLVTCKLNSWVFSSFQATNTLEHCCNIYHTWSAIPADTHLSWF